MKKVLIASTLLLSLTGCAMQDRPRTQCIESHSAPITVFNGKTMNTFWTTVCDEYKTIEPKPLGK